MELPLKALKTVAEANPTTGHKNHVLTWDPENDFMLHVWINDKSWTFKFDPGETLEDIMKQIGQISSTEEMDAKVAQHMWQSLRKQENTDV